jgi:hypothetical protein
LPLVFTTLWIGSSLYYYDYTDGVYYAPAPAGGYTVVPPPVVEPSPGTAPDQGTAPPDQGTAPDQSTTPDQSTAPDQGTAPNQGTAPDQGTAPSTAPNPIFYPRKGQSDSQTDADRRACERWAATQQNANSDATVFQRALAACMDGRGYSVG